MNNFEKLDELENYTYSYVREWMLNFDENTSKEVFYNICIDIERWMKMNRDLNSVALKKEAYEKAAEKMCKS